MKNYELLNSKEFKYLNYVAENIKEIQVDIKKYFTKDRDMKLRLLIENDLPKVKEELEGGLQSIIDKFNKFSFNLTDEDIDKLENLAEDITKLKQYFDYVVVRMEQLEKYPNAPI